MTIKNGSNVTVHYKLTVDGDVIENSFENDPLVFTSGSNQMISGFENQLQGLSTGDQKIFTLKPEEAYGPVSKEAIQQIPKSAFQDLQGLTVGSVVQLRSGEHTFQAKIIEETAEDLTLDLNHPLAGKDLTFEIKVVDVK